MRLAPPLLILALASAAAQGEWEFRLSSDTLTPQEPSVTVTLAAPFPLADFAFAGAGWSVHATEPGWSNPERLPLQIPPTLHPCASCDGTIEGRDVARITHGQLYLFGFVPDPANPIALWEATFTVTDFSAARAIALSTTTSRFLVYTEDLGPGMSPIEPRPIDEGRAIIRVIPAPAPLALLALSATRRRRPR